MNHPGSYRSRLGAWSLAAGLLAQTPLVEAAPRARQSLDDGWRFHRGDAPGAERIAFDDAGWAPVSLPHDWSIGGPIDHAAPAGGAGGFLPSGIGWYRRTVALPETWDGRRVTIEFEGAMANAEVWINGVALGGHPYGYTPFSFDLTPHLRAGAGNILCVRLDNSAQPASRWYAGAGLYRHVWLHASGPVHLAEDGVFVASELQGGGKAMLRIEALVKNETSAPAAVRLEATLLDPSGNVAGTVSAAATIAAGGEWKPTPSLPVADAQLWSPESPALYRVLTRLWRDGDVLDEIATTCGLRAVRVSVERGFELNGRPLKLVGGNVHHDNGPLGAAAFDRAEERKAELLKAAGFNAVRTAHNPPSAAFLDACDRLGLLVMDEIFDGWEKPKNRHDYGGHFREWWQRDVDAWIRRDRNHPSVVFWSAGNEMYERGNARGLELAREMVARIRALDPTRPVTAGINGLGETGDWTHLDPLYATFEVAGYNYEVARHAADHARVPSRVILSTESYQNEALANWEFAQSQPYVLGDFVWSALDYLGEAAIGRVFRPDEIVTRHWEGDQFPWHGAYCGDIDITGWRKPVSHYRAIVWDRGEKLYAAVLAPAPGGKPWSLTPWSMPPALPSWSWAGHEGETLNVEVYSRYDAVRLSVGGKTLGEKPTGRAEGFKAVFAVPYEPGELRVVGLRGGREVESLGLETAGAPAALRLTADRTNVHADGSDLAFVTIEAVDRRGVWQPASTAEVKFSVEGAGALAAVGNGDMTAMASYAGDAFPLFQGRALAVVRTKKSAGRIVLRATAAGLPPAELILNSHAP
jgi:beta-galactosidase